MCSLNWLFGLLMKHEPISVSEWANMDERKFTHYAYGAEDSGCDPQLAERYLETPRSVASAAPAMCAVTPGTARMAA